MRPAGQPRRESAAGTGGGGPSFVRGGSWNHNTRYHGELLRQLPERCDRVLDVGCGDARFARRLAARAGGVLALDIDPDQVERARAAVSGTRNIHVRCGDFLGYQEAPGAFDAVTALAVIHHMPFESALARMRQLVRPGGMVLILGLWPATATPADAAVSAVAVLANRILQRRHGPTLTDAPTAAATMPLHDVRVRASRVLPGATVRRRLLWRYLLVWTKPGLPNPPG